jgi:hypothetical protein
LRREIERDGLLGAIVEGVEDVENLLCVGIVPFSTLAPLLCTAIQNAVHYGKPGIFDLLLPSYQHMPIDTADPRGWTLLHISVPLLRSALSKV